MATQLCASHRMTATLFGVRLDRRLHFQKLSITLLITMHPYAIVKAAAREDAA